MYSHHTYPWVYPNATAAEPEVLKPIIKEVFGIQIRDWHVVRWFVFGFIGAIIWYGLRVAEAPKWMVVVWTAYGLTHWPLGVFMHFFHWRNATFNQEYWNNARRRNSFLMAGLLLSGVNTIITLYAWIGVYTFATIMFAYWAKTQPRKQPSE